MTKGQSRYNLRFEDHKGAIYLLLLDNSDPRKRPRYIVKTRHPGLGRDSGADDFDDFIRFKGKYTDALKCFGDALAESLRDFLSIKMVRRTLAEVRCSPLVSFLDRLHQLERKPTLLVKLLPRAYRAAFKVPRKQSRERKERIKESPEVSSFEGLKTSSDGSPMAWGNE